MSLPQTDTRVSAELAARARYNVKAQAAWTVAGETYPPMYILRDSSHGRRLSSRPFVWWAPGIPSTVIAVCRRTETGVEFTAS